MTIGGSSHRTSNATATAARAQEAVVRQLAATDRKVRAHEQAHLAAAGQYASGGAHYQTQRGPDGKQYAVAGDVPIDVSPVPGDPAATVAKARAIQAAARAPADPSTQDRAVAATAARLEQEALTEQRTGRKGAATAYASNAGSAGSGVGSLLSLLG